MVYGLGFRVLRSRISDFGFRISDSGFEMWATGFRV
jgi:hypothetical protein